MLRARVMYLRIWKNKEGYLVVSENAAVARISDFTIPFPTFPGLI
jgi:hypothetical protein